MFDKRSKTLIIIFVLLIISVVYLESTKPQPVNWIPSYVAKHKIPYGTYVLHNELKAIFPNSDINDVHVPPYEFLQDSTISGTYFFVDNAITFGEAEFNKLLAFVNRGNEVFISTHGVSVDTLNVSSKQLVTSSLEELPFFKLTNKSLATNEFEFDRQFDNIVFSKIDTLKTVALGKSGFVNSNNERVAEGINFIKVPFGKGFFYFHTFPEAFTNYFILKSPNQQYTASLLSYLNPSKPVFWDAYYKTGKTRIASPMYYLLSNKSLRWAYYVSLTAILFFVIFEGKRKQRSIQIIEPLKNQTLAFTRTIANMYYEKSDHKQIAEHKITHLLEFIRNKLHVPTAKIDEAFFNYVAARSTNTKGDVQKLFTFIERLHTKNTISAEELTQLEKDIEKFKNPI